MEVSEGLREHAQEELTNIMQAIKRRREISKRIGEIKFKKGFPTEDPQREFELRRWLNREFGDDEIYGLVFNEIVRDSLRLQGFKDKPAIQSAATDRVGGGAILANVGEPHYDDKFILEDIKIDLNGISLDKYNDPGGSIEGRTRVAEFLSKSIGYDLSADEVMFTEGGRFGIYLAMIATSKGKSVGYFEPSWPAFEELAWEANIRPYKFGLREGSWELEVPEAIQEINGAVIVNSPGNPTGKVLKRQELGPLVDSMSERAYLIDDESYRDLTFSSKRVITPPEVGFEHFVSIYSFSKGFGLPGLRIGIAFGDRKIISLMKEIQKKLLTSPPAYEQAIAIKLIDHDEILEVHRMESERKMEMTYRALRHNNRFEFTKPEGGLYFFIKYKSQSRAWVDLAKRGLLTAPGTSFGEYPDYFRFTFQLDSQELNAALGILETF